MTDTNTTPEAGATPAVDTSREEVMRLLDGVTPGPWTPVAAGQADDLNEVVVYRPEFKSVADAEGANARFIAASRDLVPALLAERDRLADEVARLTAEVESYSEANYRQALCIDFAAGALGPNYSATIEGLPKACRHMKLRAEAAEAEAERLRAEIARLTAAIAQSRAETQAALAGCVKIRPLVWIDNPDQALDCWMVDDFGLYQITDELVLFTGHESTGRKFDALEAAKAAAQSDYEARILAAIQPDTSKLGQVREALTVADQVSRDLGWHRIYDVTGPALASIGEGE